MKVITLVSAKGGVAKSDSAISISYVLSQLGYKVLLIDTDPQNAVTRHFVNDITQIKHKTLRQLFLKKQYIHDCLIPAYDGIDLIPSQLRLLNIEKELADENNPLFILHDVLIEVDNGYDFCIIDIAEVLDNIGIKKLRTLTAMKDKIVKYEILDKLITGESISTDEISQMNKKVKQTVIDDIEITVLENGSSVLFDGKEVLKFITTDPTLRKEVVKAIRRYYSGSKT